MMQNPSGLVALLLVMAIIIMPLRSCAPARAYLSETPLTASGVSASQNESAQTEDSGHDTAAIIKIAVIVIVVIIIIHLFAQTDNQSHGWR